MKHECTKNRGKQGRQKAEDDERVKGNGYDFRVSIAEDSLVGSSSDSTFDESIRHRGSLQKSEKLRLGIVTAHLMSSEEAAFFLPTSHNVQVYFPELGQVLNQ